jgi:hypothetical protein
VHRLTLRYLSDTQKDQYAHGVLTAGGLMHAFENLIEEILEAEGYWVQHSYKVSLTKEDKQQIGRPSSPRWEVDMLAYRAPDNLVLAVECKSYLDSPGVDLADIQGGRYADRYKLFTDPELRKVVFRRIAADLVKAKLCPENPTIQLALAAGRLKSDPVSLRAYFDNKGWTLFDPDWVRERLEKTTESSYTNSVAVMVAKMLLREKHGNGPKRTKPTIL